MRGYWLTRTEAIYALGTTPAKWNNIESTFERKMNKKGTKKLFFIPEQKATKEYRELNIPAQHDEEQIDEVIEQLEDNVDFEDEAALQSINVQLKKARKQKILTETKYLEQKLEQRKKILFNQWSEKFFDCFSKHFAKLKNTIVELHLNEEQVKAFNQGLDNCLNNLQLNLDEIWSDFALDKTQEIQQ